MFRHRKWILWVALSLGPLALGALAVSNLMSKPSDTGEEMAAKEEERDVDETPDTPIVEVPTLTAAVMIEAGTIINPNHVEQTTDIEGNVHQRFIDTATTGISGSIARYDISADTLIGPEQIVRPSDPGFLKVVIQPGHRAITVRVGEATREAGALLSHGDRVDVIATTDVTIYDNLRERYAKTIVENVRIVAINNEAGVEPAPANIDEDGNNERRSQIRNVTLEVTPREGERLAAAESGGQLLIALRSERESVERWTAPGHAGERFREILVPATLLRRDDERLEREKIAHAEEKSAEIAEFKIRAAGERAGSTIVRIARGGQPIMEEIFEGEAQ